MGRKSDLEVKPVVNEPFVGSTYQDSRGVPFPLLGYQPQCGQEGQYGAGWAWLFAVWHMYVRLHIFLHSCAQLATRTYAHVEGEIVFDQTGSTSIWSEFWAISYT